MAQQERDDKFRILCGPLEQGWTYGLVEAVRLARRWCLELWIDLAIWQADELVVVVKVGGEVIPLSEPCWALQESGVGR